VEFYSNLSAIYTKLCAQTFLPIFGVFTIFHHNFAKIVVPFVDGHKQSLVRLKEQSILKKGENSIKIHPQTEIQYLFKVTAPRPTAHRQTGA